MGWEARHILREAQPAEGHTPSVGACRHAHCAARGEQIVLLAAQLLPTTSRVQVTPWRPEHPIWSAHEQLTQITREPPSAPVAHAGTRPRKLSVGRVAVSQLIFQRLVEQFPR